MFASCPPAETIREFFSDLHPKSLVGLIEMKLTTCGISLRLDPKEFLPLKLVYIYP